MAVGQRLRLKLKELTRSKYDNLPGMTSLGKPPARSAVDFQLDATLPVLNLR